MGLVTEGGEYAYGTEVTLQATQIQLLGGVYVVNIGVEIEKVILQLVFIYKPLYKKEE